VATLRHARVGRDLVEGPDFRMWDGVGKHPYFPDRCGYETPEDAAAAWARHRRAAWAATHRFSIPRAARVHDALTTRGFEMLRGSCGYATIDATATILDAINSDERAIRIFERAEEAAATDIADFLGLLREDLNTARDLTERIAQAPDMASRPDVWCGLSSAARYGDSASMRR